MKQYSQPLFFLSSSLVVVLAVFNWRSPLSDALLKLWHDEATPAVSLSCPNHNYRIHIFSKDPLVVYISSFLSTEEVQELASLSETEFEQSKIRLENGTTVLNDNYRSSRTAYPTGNARLHCIANRGQAFQGFGSLTGDMEALQIVKYGPSDHCGRHYDGTGDNPRVSSFFAYLYSNGTGGGTNFPLLEPPAEKQWCEFLDCSESAPEGVTFKPIVGNALYWENLQESGEAHPKTLHAGLPVTSGLKIGLNIWTQKKTN